MKILYLNSTPFDSEKANLIQVKAMCKAMTELNHDVILSLPKGGNVNIDNVDYKIDFRRQYFKNKIDKYVSIGPLIKSIKSADPDILYIRDPQLLIYAFLFSRKKIIYETHNSVLHQGYIIVDKIYRYFLKLIIAKGFIKKLVCISQELAEYWKNQGIPINKIVVAHDGIDMSLFNLRKKINIREDLLLPIDKKIVTYSGRLYANRKIDNLLILASKFPDTFFLVVGGPDLNAKYYEHKIKELNLENIKFTGQVKHEQVPYYLEASDILLAIWSHDVPTIKYCSPLKIFEYMAAKKTILAHGFPTIKEILVDKIDALLVKPDDIDDLVEKLNEALTISNSGIIANNAYEKAKNEYTWKKRVGKIFDSL